MTTMRGRSNYFKLFVFGASLMPLNPAFSNETIDCNTSASKLGKQESSKSLTIDCSKFVFDRAPASQIATSAHGGYSAAAYKNAISIVSNLKENQYDFIAGENTGLFDVQGVAIASTQKQVWVINQTLDNKIELKAFVSRYGGNLKPLKAYDDEKLNGAKYIQLSQSGDEVALWYPNTSTIKIFTTEIPPGSAFTHLKFTWKREIKIPVEDANRLDTFVWVSEQKRIIFTKNDQNQVLIFSEPDSVSGTASLVKYETAGKSKDSKLVRVYWGSKEEGLFASFKDGTTELLGKDL